MGILKTKKKSLDLLTAEEEAVKSSGNKFLIISIFAGIIILELVVYGVLTLLSLGDRSKLRDLTEQVAVESQSAASFNTLATDIKNVKNKLTTYEQKISNFTIDKKLEKFSSLIPTDVTLVSLTITDVGKVVVKSESALPESGYQFFEVLKADKEVTGLSLDAVTKSANKYSFDMSFTVTTK